MGIKVFNRSKKAKEEDKKRKKDKKKNKSEKEIIKETLKDDEIVSIAEKVKFWQEQDRINKTIIPRVLNNHELIIKLKNQISDKNDEISSLKIENDKLKNRIKKLEHIGINPKANLTMVYVASATALIISIISIIV